jgi:iron complex transport system substrate-binding protein
MRLPADVPWPSRTTARAIAVRAIAAGVLLTLWPQSATFAQAAPARARIVSLSSAISEIIFALGAGDQVVAVAQGITYPEAAAALPHVGPARTVTAEPVLQFRPTLVLGDTTLPAATVQQLRAAGVRVELLPGDAAANVSARVRTVGTLLNRRPRGDALADSLSRALTREAALPPLQVRALFVYARGGTSAFVSGTGTGAHEMLTLAGARNAAVGFAGYRPVTAEAVAAAAPDVIVVPARGLSSIGGVSGLLALPGLAQTPAGRARRVVAVDDQLLLGFGPRTIDAVRELRRAFTANASLPATTPTK